MVLVYKNENVMILLYTRDSNVCFVNNKSNNLYFSNEMHKAILGSISLLGSREFKQDEVLKYRLEDIDLKSCSYSSVINDKLGNTENLINQIILQLLAQGIIKAEYYLFW